MRRMILSVAAVLAAAVPLGLWKAAPSGAEGNGMQISRDETRPATHGPAETFTGQVSVKALFDPNDARQFSSAQVSFTPCARTAWHTHPGGQTPGRHLGKRLGAGMGWPETGHRSRRCDLDTTWRQALARCH